MKIVLFLMSNKGYEVLKSIIDNDFICYIESVVIGLDKEVVQDYSTEMIELCGKNRIDYFFSNQHFEISSSYVLAISWRWIIPINNFQLIVLHDSLLPKYRGFAPLVNALINNEKTVGVTALLASEEYDRGAIILQKELRLSYPITINDAITKISSLYSEIVLGIIKKISLGKEITTFPQIEDNATYSLWRDSEDYFINWNASSEDIKRFIDAVGFPYQGARCFIADEVVVIQDVTLINDVIIENRDVGKVIFIQGIKPVVVCGVGLLKINEAIFENSKNSILPLKKFRTRFK